MAKLQQRYRVLLVGEHLSYSKGGIVTVMKMMLKSDYLNDRVKFIKVDIGVRSSYLGKAASWMKGMAKYVTSLASCDLIHIHHAANLNFEGVSKLVFLTKILNKNKKVFLHNHGRDFESYYECKTPKGKEKVVKTFNSVNGNIVLSRHWLDWYRSVAPHARWILLPNAVPVRRPKTAQRNNNKVTFLFFGRMERTKGTYDILSVMDEVIKAVSNVHFIFAGDGEVTRVKKIVHENQWDDYVEVLGWVSEKEKPQLFEKSDIFLLPSYFEGLPMSLLETMSYGIVPITTSVSGIPEVVENGKDGFLIQAGDKVDLTDKMIRLATDASCRNYMARNSFEKIQESYSFRSYERKLLSIYEDVISKS